MWRAFDVAVEDTFRTAMREALFVGTPADLFTLGDPRTFGDLVAPAELRTIASYAAQVGVHTTLIVPLDGSGDVFLMNTFTDAQLLVSTDVVALSVLRTTFWMAARSRASSA